MSVRMIHIAIELTFFDKPLFDLLAHSFSIIARLRRARLGSKLFRW